MRGRTRCRCAISNENDAPTHLYMVASGAAAGTQIQVLQDGKPIGNAAGSDVVNGIHTVSAAASTVLSPTKLPARTPSNSSSSRRASRPTCSPSDKSKRGDAHRITPSVVRIAFSALGNHRSHLFRNRIRFFFRQDQVELFGNANLFLPDPAVLLFRAVECFCKRNRCRI